MSRSESSFGRRTGFAVREKRYEEGFAVVGLPGKWCVDVARPPSESSWVINWDIVLGAGRERLDIIAGRLTEDVV